jgi:hypothetical protein
VEAKAAISRMKHRLKSEDGPQCPTRAPSVIALNASGHLWK